MVLIAMPPPRWDREGHGWPNREASRFVHAGGIRWHVQEAGSGPTVLLLHGTGASTHSFRDVLPLLARDVHVIAPDLPGHGFTETPPFYRLNLVGMARLLAHLLGALGARPVVAVGHSAGAAILVEMARGERCGIEAIVGFNAALRPFPGAVGPLFSTMAKVIFLNPLAPRAFALLGGDARRVRQLIESTGSTIDEEGIEYYRRLFARPGHWAGLLGMMAGWELGELARAFPTLKPRLVLVAGEADRAVPPSEADRVARAVPRGEVRRVKGHGHLLHEENPELAAAIVREVAGVDIGTDAPPFVGGRDAALAS